MKNNVSSLNFSKISGFRLGGDDIYLVEQVV